MRELIGDAEEDASREASGVNDLDHRTIPPFIGQNKCLGSEQLTFMRD